MNILIQQFIEYIYINIRQFVVHTVTKSIPMITRIGPIDRLCLESSLEKLEERRLEEGTEPSVEDLLHTTGYWVVENAEWLLEDRIHGNRPYRGVGVVPGQFQGFGAYKSLGAVQEFNSILTLCNFLQKQNIESVMEIGSKRGGSLYLWSRSLQPALAISVDINFVSNRKEFFERFSDVRTFCIEGNSSSNTTKKRVQELLDKFEMTGLDYIYIDGGHDYEQVKKDFETYRNFINKNGLICLHDIYNYSTGVPRYWSQLQKNYKTAEFGVTGPKNGLVFIEE